MSYSSTAALALDRAIPPLFLHHLAALALGLLGGGVAGRLPLSAWHALAPLGWVVGALLLLATELFGVEVNGAQRWLEIPGTGFRFQPVEPVKIATLVAVAAAVARRDGKHELGPRRALVALLLVAVPIAFLLRQPDLGNAIVLAGLSGMLVLAAGTPIRQLVLPGLLGAGGIAAYIATNDYAWRRVVAFLNPWDQAQGAGFQLVQSFTAFGAGGLFGAGLGNGRQKLFYLPEGHTDFILALVAEELGLLGVLFVLGAFAALWIAGTRVARAAPDRFALLLAFAMTSLLALPAAVNAAVVMGLLPTKGLTLPFLSYGGTSLISSCVALGILLGIGLRHAPPEPDRISQASLRGLR
jgi:cell division protein FtsW